MANQQSIKQDQVYASLKQKLAGEVGVVSWEALAPHAERGALFWVDQSLDLVEVGVSLALDDAQSVKAWQETSLLLPAASLNPKDFAAFRFLIIQPFVLAMPLDLPGVIDPTSPDEHER